MSCRIILDNPGNFNSGDIVRGRVVCDFNSQENIKGIKCKFRGREETHWTEHERNFHSSNPNSPHTYQNHRHNRGVGHTNNGRSTVTVHYKGENKFISVDRILIGAVTLPAGHYEYPFAFEFPRGNSPSPYNGTYGSIRYYIKANVDKSFAFDYTDEVTLVLVAPINFNDIRHELQLNPVNYSDDKRICCCCCGSDPITMNLILQKEAFIIGENLNVKVELSNMSNTTISELRATLNLFVESRATTPRNHTKEEKTLITKINETGVGAHGKKTYQLDLQVPPSTIIPNFGGSTLFKQWCVLHVTAVLPGCHGNLDIRSTIKLGHIPLGAYSNPANSFPAGAYSNPPNSFPATTYPAVNTVGGSLYPPVPPEKQAPFFSGGAPTAPSKAEMAANEGFEIVNNDGRDQPPAYGKY